MEPCKQLKALCSTILFVFIAATAVCQVTSPQKPVKPQDQKDFVPLTDVVKVVESVLTQVQDHLNEDNSPPLQSAEFDFQTVTTNDTTGGLIISIVTLEGEHVRTTTRETDFTYSVPPAHSTASPNVLGFGWLKSLIERLRKTAKPEDFNKTLPAAIVAAADTMNAVRSITSGTGTPLSQRQFVVTISFSVTNSFNAGVDPSTLIVVAPELKYAHSKQNVQTLKLTFADQ